MSKALQLVTLAACALALGGCATQRYHEEEPHHFSRDADGNRIACYATEVASEYECVPVVRRYPRAYHDPYWDPFWPHVSLGFWYGWPHYYPGTVWYPAPRHPHRPWRHHFPRHR
jgi:hypothetical protein